MRKLIPLKPSKNVPNISFQAKAYLTRAKEMQQVEKKFAQKATPNKRRKHTLQHIEAGIEAATARRFKIEDILQARQILTASNPKLRKKNNQK